MGLEASVKLNIGKVGKKCRSISTIETDAFSVDCSKNYIQIIKINIKSKYYNKFIFFSTSEDGGALEGGGVSIPAAGVEAVETGVFDAGVLDAFVI